MNINRIRRLYYIIFLILGTIVAFGLILFALRKNINLFFTPSQIKQGQVPIGTRIRIGGMVEEGSVKRKTGLIVSFNLTDYHHKVAVNYTGILPDLFREKQGVVALGHLETDGFFKADEILAKHDEKYMPAEIHEAIKKDRK